MKLVFSQPRTVPFFGKGEEKPLKPWIEICLVVRVQVSEWDFQEITFEHWAAPWLEKTSGLEWQRFDPGTRAALAGASPEVEVPSLAPAEAESLVGEVAALLPREMYRQRMLGLVSGFGEPFAAFRHRCLKVAAQSVQEGLLRRDPAAARAVAALVEGIERKSLGVEDKEVMEARVGFAFYPEGLGPALASRDLMVEGKIPWQG